MDQNQARSLIEANPNLGAFVEWVAVGQLVRNNKEVVHFIPPPGSENGQNSSPNGHLYVYQEGQVEFVGIDDNGSEQSVTLEMIEQAKRIMEAPDGNLDSYGFCGIYNGDDDQLLLRFEYVDGMLYRPSFLVDLQNGTYEHFPDDSGNAMHL